MSNYFKRYLAGECTTVWKEIRQLGQKAFETDTFSDVSAVLNETMKRVKYNIDIIYQRLLDMGYKFYECVEHARVYPDKNTEEQLLLVDKNINCLGYLPLSIKEFYRIVGSVNFVWDYKNYPDKMWFEYADPLYIMSIKYLLSEAEEDWPKRMEDNINNGFTSAYIDISPDYYHKDNVSGGCSYGIEVTKEPLIDSRLLFEENNLSFIEYLRKCFDFGGFPRVTVNNVGYEDIITELKIGLKQI